MSKYGFIYTYDYDNGYKFLDKQYAGWLALSGFNSVPNRILMFNFKEMDKNDAPISFRGVSLTGERLLLRSVYGAPPVYRDVLHGSWLEVIRRCGSDQAVLPIDVWKYDEGVFTFIESYNLAAE